MYVKYLNLNQDYLEYKTHDNELINLSKTNVFIGKNNSGKSRLMRQLLIKEYGNIYYVNKISTDFIELKENVEKLVNLSNEYVYDQYSKTYLFREIIKSSVYRSEADENQLIIFLSNLLFPEDGETIYNKAKKLKIFKDIRAFQCDKKFQASYHDVGKKKIKIKIKELYFKIMDSIEIIEPETIFFPSILSLRKLNNLCDDSNSTYHKGISKMFLNDYFSKVAKFTNIKTGQEVYDDMKKQLLGLNVERQQFLKYEEYVSSNFFNGKAISIFIKDDDNNIYIKEGDEEPYPIYLLGDGLQTLITITYYLYMNNDKPLKVFIDEPEIHLHPGLQHLLISKLQEYENCQYFISTHSASMIDICDEYDSDTSIICVEKMNGQKYVYNSAYDDLNIFDLIGTRPSSLILSNCTIWVEGPTDVYYIDSFLKMYAKLKKKKQYKIGYNYNYAFNGSINIASKIDFSNDDKAAMKINKLSRNNFIIFDSDNLNKEHANYKKIKTLQENLKDSCYVVKGLKTIENIIPPSFLLEYFDKNYEPKQQCYKKIILSFFESLEDIYLNGDYFKLDIIKSMQEYLINALKENKLHKEITAEECNNYCKNLWKSNKYDLSLHFSNKVSSLTDEEIEVLYNNTLKNFKNMIKEIYNFIDKVN